MSEIPTGRLGQIMGDARPFRHVDQPETPFSPGRLQELVIVEVKADRRVRIGDQWVVHFGSDSFLGLDQDPRVQDTLRKAVRRWGTHTGSFGAFAAIRANVEAEERLARWLGTEAALIYPSVAIANLAALPGLLGRQDLLLVEERANDSIQESAKIARHDGVRVESFALDQAGSLERSLERAGSYRCAVIALDGVESMSGRLAPLAALDALARQKGALLYVDDTHGTGVLGPRGRGTIPDSLGRFDNVLVVGSLSNAFSCAGGFLGCPAKFKRLLKTRSRTDISGEPVPPPYLEVITRVIDILESDEYETLRAALDYKVQRLTAGLARLGLVVLGARLPLVNILVGGAEETLEAGRLLLEQGFFVPSVVYPAAPDHAGVLRVHINVNHSTEAIDGLLEALSALKDSVPLPQRD